MTSLGPETESRNPSFGQSRIETAGVAREALNCSVLVSGRGMTGSLSIASHSTAESYP